MTIQTINIGNVVNDGLGDDLRSAFQKVNANFTELQSTLTVTASNLGTTGESIFKEKIGNDLRFKTLTAGPRILLESLTDTIRITAQAVPDAFNSIATNNGDIVAVKDSTNNITIQGGQGARNIRVTASGSVIEIDSVLDLNALLLNYDFGLINGANNAIQLALSASNLDFGTFVNPGRIDLNLGSI